MASSATMKAIRAMRRERGESFIGRRPGCVVRSLRLAVCPARRRLAPAASLAPAAERKPELRLLRVRMVRIALPAPRAAGRAFDAERRAPALLLPCIRFHQPLQLAGDAGDDGDAVFEQDAGAGDGGQAVAGEG